MAWEKLLARLHAVFPCGDITAADDGPLHRGELSEAFDALLDALSDRTGMSGKEATWLTDEYSLTRGANVRLQTTASGHKATEVKGLLLVSLVAPYAVLWTDPRWPWTPLDKFLLQGALRPVLWQLGVDLVEPALLQAVRLEGIRLGQVPDSGTLYEALFWSSTGGGYEEDAPLVQ